jgi:photosystem II stability/assembly factor-like uncharacterized protein
MRLLRLFLPLFSLFSLVWVSFADAQSWKVQTSGTDTNLRGVSVVYVQNKKGAQSLAIWSSGSNGAILRSLDEGTTWQRLSVAGGETLDFRGIVAFDDKSAYVMSSGEGDRSRIYKTKDGGATWALQYSDKRKEFFLDTIACLSETHCFALGDPINGKFVLLNTIDGEHWNPLPTDYLPNALPTEGAFAASNSSLLVYGETVLFGTGGPAARVFRSSDLGRSWSVAETPLAHGNASSGIFSLTRWRGTELIAVGGDYRDPKRASGASAYSLDDGQTWQLSSQLPGGFRSGVASNAAAVFAIGPDGGDFSVDGGVSWKRTDSLNLNAAALLDNWNGWAVGPNGTIARFVPPSKTENR